MSNASWIILPFTGELVKGFCYLKPHNEGVLDGRITIYCVFSVVDCLGPVTIFTRGNKRLIDIFMALKNLGRTSKNLSGLP